MDQLVPIDDKVVPALEPADAKNSQENNKKIKIFKISKKNKKAL